MEIDNNKLNQITQPVKVVLNYDLVKLQRENEVKRASLWNQIETSESLFERELLGELPQGDRDRIASEFSLAKLLLATAARVNNEKNQIIKQFSETELDLIISFERFNIFDILSPQEIADRIYRRAELYNLAMGFYQNEYAKLDDLLDSPEVQKDLKIAFNLRYRDRMGKVVQGVQAFIGKYGLKDTVAQVEDVVRTGGTIEKTRVVYEYKSQPPSNTAEKPKPAEHQEKPNFWSKLNRLEKILTISVLTLTLLGLLGWRFGPWWSSSGSEYSLIFNAVPADEGTVQVSPLPNVDGKYTKGTPVTLEARETSTSRFVRWSGDAQGTIPTIVITMSGDKEVLAEFTSR